MARCANCEQPIVFGGIKAGDDRYCSKSCQESHAKSKPEHYCENCKQDTPHVQEPIWTLMTDFRFQRFLGVIFAAAVLGILTLLKVEISEGVFVLAVVPVFMIWVI